MSFHPVACEERDKLVAQDGVKALGGNTNPGVYHCTLWGFPGDDDLEVVVRDEIWYGRDGLPRLCEHWVPS